MLKCILKTLLILSLMISASFTAYAVCDHSFEFDVNKSNLISHDDMTHSYYCLKGCGSYGTVSGGINSKEKCTFYLLSENKTTCTEEGIRNYMCNVCYRYKEEIIPKKEHSYIRTRRLPTCTQGGYDLYTCIDCDVSYTDNTVQPVAHISDGGVIEVLPTYEKEGVIKSSCRVCDCVIQRKTAPCLVKSDNKTAPLNGNTVGKDSISATTVTEPGKAVITKIKSAKKSKVVIKWKNQKNLKGYEISYSAYKFSKKKTVKAVTVTKGTQKTLNKLKSGKKYYFRIRAYKKFGSRKVYGAYSDTKTVKIR